MFETRIHNAIRYTQRLENMLQSQFNVTEAYSDNVASRLKNTYGIVVFAETVGERLRAQYLKAAEPGTGLNMFAAY